MSNAIAQSATVLAVSNSVSDWDELTFADRTKLAAERTSKGTTRERRMINRNKLVSAVCADYRAHFAALYGKTDRLPSEVFEKIQTAVDKYIVSTLNLVNPLNAITYRRSFFHNAKEMEVTERLQNTGENKLTLQEQHLGINLFIGAAEKRLKDLEAKKTPDYDREKEVKAQIMRLNITKQFIEGEIAHQAKVQSEAKP
jgi:hypothetical protein